MAIPQMAVVHEEIQPVRGVKLKTVSAFTMLFALACLGAFMAGRPPVVAADSSQSVKFTQTQAKQRELLHGYGRKTPLRLRQPR